MQEERMAENQTESQIDVKRNETGMPARQGER